MATDILVKIGADITQFSRAMSEANKGLTNFSRANQETFNAFKNVGAGITAFGVTVAGGLGFAAKQAIDFESSFAGMRKTISASESEFAVLEKGIRDMAKELPASVHEIAAVGEAAGQLGIKKEAILDFTRTMIDMGESTNLSSDEAATAFARFANIVGMEQSKFSNLGSTVVTLGNNLATTESEIVAMGMRIAAAGNQAGMSEAEIMALSGAMSSLGIEAEAGGTAASMVMTKITNAVDKGGKSLNAYAKAAGVSAKDFAEMWKNEPAKAFEVLLAGLDKSAKAGKNMTDIFDSLGIKGIRELDVMKRLAAGHELLSDAREIATKSFKENTALSDEAAQRYETLASQLAMLKNTVIDAAISIGQALMPAIQLVTDVLKGLVERFNNLSQGTKGTVAIVAAIAAAFGLLIGPALMLVGFIPQLIAGFTAVTTVLSSVGAAFSFLAGPIGIIIAAIVGIGAALVLAYNKVEWFRDMLNEAWAWIQEATSIAFNFIADIIRTVISDVVSIVSENTAKIQEIWNKHGHMVMAIIKLVMGVVQSIVNAGMGVIRGIFQVVWPIISNVVKTTWNLIKTIVDVGIRLVMGIIDTVMSLIKGDWQGAWTAIKKTAEDIWKKIKSFFESVDLVQVGKDIIQGLINGIGSMAGAVWQAAKNIAKNVKDSIMSFLGVASPAKELIKIGKFTGEGFAIGIERMKGQVKRASKVLAEAAIPDTPAISMSYATPSGSYASLAGAIDGTIDVNASENNRLLAGIYDELRKQKQMIIEMDKREVGRMVAPTVSEEINTQTNRRGRARGQR